MVSILVVILYIYINRVQISFLICIWSLTSILKVGLIWLNCYELIFTILNQFIVVENLPFHFAKKQPIISILLRRTVAVDSKRHIRCFSVDLFPPKFKHMYLCASPAYCNQVLGSSLGIIAVHDFDEPRRCLDNWSILQLSALDDYWTR